MDKIIYNVVKFIRGVGDYVHIYKNEQVGGGGGGGGVVRIDLYDW